jgi:hypothetical protein
LDTPLTVGSRVGPYEVVEAIGAGGMGVVFRARDHALERDVAVKVLPPAVGGDDDRHQRFAREARLLAALNHPHIAQMYGIEDSSTGSAIVMELGRLAGSLAISSTQRDDVSADRQWGGLRIMARITQVTV